MRLGVKDKKIRGRAKRRSSPKPSSERSKPHYSSSNLVVGQVSSNLITSVFAPILTEIAGKTLEKYVEEEWQYNDLMEQQRQQQKISEDSDEAEIGVDGTVDVTFDVLDPPKPPIFHSQHSIDELADVLSETSLYFMSNDWKIQAKAAKFERQLDEKYGVFRPFITNHPEVENFIKVVQRRHAKGDFSPFRKKGKGPISQTSSIMLLFMLQRNGVKWEPLMLAALFLLVGLQPWALVTIVALGNQQLNKRKSKPVGTMKSSLVPIQPYYTEMNNDQKKSKLMTPVGSPLKDNEQVEGKFDTIIVGAGPATLYTAALLSRAGRKVLVLSHQDDASGCLVLKQENHKFSNIPFDVDSSNVSRLSKLQATLAPALCTTTDLQGGVRFAKIGSAKDGHAFEILSIPGMGSTDGKEAIPFVVSSHVNQLVEDAAAYLSDDFPSDIGGVSQSANYRAVCAHMNSTSSQYYLTKVLPENVNNLRSDNPYQAASIRHVQPFLDKSFPLNVHVRSLFAGLGMKGENIPPSQTSMGAHVTNVCAALSGEGMHYPVGGPRSLCHALATVIEQCGGRVATGIHVKELLFEAVPENGKKEGEETKADQNSEEKKKDEQTFPRCIGVELKENRILKLAGAIGGTKPKSGIDGIDPAVVCMDGFISTFLHQMPTDIRDRYKVPRGLPAMSERRPLMKVLLVLNGSPEDLNLTGADFYRLPMASVAQDEVDPETNAVKFGQIGVSGQDIEAKIEKAPSRGKTTKATAEVEDYVQVSTSNKKKRKVKFDSGLSWIQISFPSAKDPSFSSCYGKNITTCVITIEADDDFVTLFDTKPRLYGFQDDKESKSGEYTRLYERVKKDLFGTFPQLEGKIECSEIRGPFRQGLSHNPERFAAKGIRAESQYPGLFVGGSDLTVGESFSGSIVGGWLAANAVTGYSMIDHLYLEKNITSDLARFLELPDELEKEDIAVPYAPPVVGKENEV